MKCTLTADINRCPYYQKDTQECLNQNNCSFQEKIVEEKKTIYEREERWYEKYMK